MTSLCHANAPQWPVQAGVGSLYDLRPERPERPTSPYPAIFPRFPSRPSLNRRRSHTSKSQRQTPHRTRESPQRYPQVRHPFRLSTLWQGQVHIRTLGLTARGRHLRGRQRCQARLVCFSEKPLSVRGSEIVVFRMHAKRGTEGGGKQ
jgi:hypothetical protein